MLEGAGAAAATCQCCGESLGPIDVVSCGQCGRSFHLAMRVDRPARDCGQAWIDEAYQALDFRCDLCLGHSSAGAAPARRPYSRRSPGRVKAVQPRRARRSLNRQARG